MIFTWGDGWKNNDLGISGVFDATGRRINHCTYVDTDTGEVVWAKHDEKMNLIPGEDGGIVWVRETVPLPVRIERFPEVTEKSDGMIETIKHAFSGWFRR